jgi:hypothetical protein
MLAAGFDPAIPASERPQTHALDRAGTGIGNNGQLLIPVLSQINLVYVYEVRAKSFRSGAI